MTGELSGRSLLAVFAHPDDESLACGGLLACCADRGARVSLVCATHGEWQSGERDEALRARRARELDAAAAVLGITEVVLLDFPDGYLPWVDAVTFDARLASEIGRLRPEVVVTFGEDGLYWHPDHCAIWERTTAVVTSLGDQAPALYYVTMPPGLMRRVADEYAGAAGGSTSVLGITDPDAFGAAAAPPTLVVDVGAYAVRKLAAIKCHRSQATGLLARVPDDAAARLLGVEHFRRAAVTSVADAFIERLPRR